MNYRCIKSVRYFLCSFTWIDKKSLLKELTTLRYSIDLCCKWWISGGIQQSSITLKVSQLIMDTYDQTPSINGSYCVTVREIILDPDYDWSEVIMLNAKSRFFSIKVVSAGMMGTRGVR